MASVRTAKTVRTLSSLVGQSSVSIIDVNNYIRSIIANKDCIKKSFDDGMFNHTKIHYEGSPPSTMLTLGDVADFTKWEIYELLTSSLEKNDLLRFEWTCINILDSLPTKLSIESPNGLFLTVNRDIYFKKISIDDTLANMTHNILKKIIYSTKKSTEKIQYIKPLIKYSNFNKTLSTYLFIELCTKEDYEMAILFHDLNLIEYDNEHLNDVKHDILFDLIKKTQNTNKSIYNILNKFLLPLHMER